MLFRGARIVQGTTSNMYTPLIFICGVRSRGETTASQTEIRYVAVVDMCPHRSTRGVLGLDLVLGIGDRLVVYSLASWLIVIVCKRPVSAETDRLETDRLFSIDWLKTVLAPSPGDVTVRQRCPSGRAGRHRRRWTALQL